MVSPPPPFALVCQALTQSSMSKPARKFGGMKGVYRRARTLRRNTSFVSLRLQEFPIGFLSCAVPLALSALGFSEPTNLSLRAAREESKFIPSSSTKQFSLLLSSFFSFQIRCSAFSTLTAFPVCPKTKNHLPQRPAAPDGSRFK